MVNPQRSGPTIECTRLTIKVTNRSWWQLPRQGTACLLEQHRGRFDGRADDLRAYRRAPAGEFSIWYVFNFLPAFQALLAQREFLIKHGEPKQLGCLRTLYDWHAPPHTFPG